MIKKYSNDEIIVVWQPEKCIHSTICWKGLINVFNPKKRPWIDINADSAQKIAEQVSKCPSGALSIEQKASVEDVLDSKEHLTIVENGPIIMNSEMTINYKGEIRKGKVALCRCGQSNKKPYCDGSHRKNNFTG
ncbi:MAG: (4Fe-4S)-binding protein [Ignavibacteriaceae bacterium]|nr:(4Fe-4S)-binding protein [Ignavibacteriaceae bacterium]